ncbi:MAG: NAD(P)H-dependent glycerol-3-phosphate dehydrogenase [Rhodocyclaceae bacterium]|jgi:glycerol-3-phosphate dehydrogenase (NAD(P)+)|nr:NAD(P)H-dependent glycerol-3-phosphate dehydrogenase [Rhodocyclaceae bacterium]
MNITVLGAGAWGTALAMALARQHEITLWGREADLLEEMARTRRNPRYLPEAILPEGLRYQRNFALAVQSADLHLVVTPLAGLRTTARQLRATAPDTPLIWACKGLEAGTSRLPHEIVAEELGAEAPCGVLTGPSFAAEVAQGLPTAVTLAAHKLDFARHWATELHQPLLRIYAGDDVVGAEVGGAVKNVMAIAAGIADGMGFGLNTRAALITRGLAEMARLGVALGGRPETFMGLAGMGDLILTCTGDLSRNRRVGLALASGRSLAEILTDLGHVAEGVGTAEAVDALANRLGVDMPITTAVAALLRGQLTPREAVESLLARDPKVE